jgi:hypothetical protein
MSHTMCVFPVSGVSPRLADLRVVLVTDVGASPRLPCCASLVSNSVSKYRSLTCTNVIR